MSQDIGVFTPPPLVLALIACDDVWIDPNTGKMTIIGVFGAVATNVFPHVLPRLTVYICLTECQPETQISVCIVDADYVREPIAEQSVPVSSNDMRVTLQGIIRFNEIAFPSAGEYRAQLYANGELLLERSLVLVKMGVHHAQE